MLRRTRKLMLIANYCFGLILSLVISTGGTAQQSYKLTLNEVITLAQSDAPDALLAKTRWEGNYWNYQTFLADYKPQVLLNAESLPLINRSIEAVTLPDGQSAFRERSLMENSLNLSLQQDFSPTGATIFVGSSLSRLDIFETEFLPYSRSYLSTPFNIGFFQPLFQYNAMKWEKRIQPILFEESEKIYSEEMEAIANRAASRFFDLLISQLDASAAIRDKSAADTLLVLSEGRFEVGKIAETDLLQISLNAMQAEARLAEAQLNMQTDAEELRYFLNLQGEVEFDLIPPYELPDIIINPETALQYAMQNRSDIIAYQRRLAIAESEVDRAKGETGISASVVGRFGLTQTNEDLNLAYQNLLDQEVLTVGLTIPIADWGKTKGRRALAQSNLELAMRQIEQEEESFRRIVKLKARQFELVRRNAEIAEESYIAATKRYDITYQRYLIGKIPVTDLNLALADRENARRGYLQSVRDYWMALYEIRGLTLYDFVDDQPLIRPTPEVR